MKRALSILMLCGACSTTSAPAPETKAPAQAPQPAATPAAAQAGGGLADAPAYSAPDEPWRKEQPKGAASPEISLPKPQIFTLKNGLRVVLVETHHVPVVSGRLLVFAGANRTKTPGLADLTAALLTEGTKSFNSIALADAIEDIGASLDAGASHDAAFVSFTTLSKHLDRTLELFNEVVTTPTFPEKELDRIRDQRLTALLQQKDSPGAMASNAAGRVVYGDAHPYAWPLIGTEASLKAFKRDDLVKFWQAWYVPQNGRLLVVGDTTADDLKTKLEAQFAGWKGHTVAKDAPPPAPKTGKRTIFVVDKPQASQSVVWVAHAGVPRSNPDYVPLLVANHILGGSAAGRLFMNLREAKGFSYGAYSRFGFGRGPSLFYAGGNMRGNSTKEAVAETMKELERIRNEKVTDEELGNAKAGTIGRMPARFETNGAIAGMLGELELNGLPLDWYATFAKKVSAVTAADVQRVAKKYMHPESAQIIVVGDKSSVEAGLKELKLGNVETRGPFGEKL
jgi:zinc protease